MKAGVVICIFTLLLVAECSTFRGLTTSIPSNDVLLTFNNAHQKVWNNLRLVGKFSLVAVIVLWGLMVGRYFMLFKTKYEYISSLMIIFALPLFYTVLSYISIVDRDTQGHLDLVRTFYEVILLFGVFNIMKIYVAFDAEAGVFRPDVLYEAVRRHEYVSLFKMPPEGTDLSKKSCFSRLVYRFKRLFYFSLYSTEEAQHFVQTITLTLWIFGGLRLISLLAGVLTNPDNGGSVFLDTIGIVAMSVAIGYSYMFVHVVRNQIPEVRAGRKFWAVKIFLALTFYQEYIVELLLYCKYRTKWTSLDEAVKNELLIWIGDALICVEMILFCFLLGCVFRFTHFKTVEVHVGTRLTKKYRQEAKEAATVGVKKNIDDHESAFASKKGIEYPEIELQTKNHIDLPEPEVQVVTNVEGRQSNV